MISHSCGLLTESENRVLSLYGLCVGGLLLVRLQLTQ